jgi:hypothetical protein
MAARISNHPARLAAIAAGEKHFLAVGFPCKRNPEHALRFADGMGCVECNRETGKVKRGTSEKLPAIGGDLDAGKTELKLIDASAKFLKLLHLEALASVRTKHHEKETA